ncbi:L-proline trans-4-hydroxylase-like [Watersipora subatra]|uniref:L-proline trans-4-hydroxylase-like n=1 Tax=Watersipora subatra TaxID=2589382 RepID=UPI00355C013E
MAALPEYRVDANGDFTVTDNVLKDFREFGFIIVRNLLDSKELEILKTTVEADAGLQHSSYGRDDGEGRRTRLALWDDPADDVTGAIARSEKVAGTFSKLLCDEVYHYHAKLIMKDAKTGGAHIWHQDYGYWYKNGCLFPDMGTVFIPIDDTDKENGCLKVIPKSHKAGRIEHVRVGDQAGADMERVEQLQDALGLHHVEMKAGDGLFFHSNILHRSEQNHSDRRRWAYLIAYNTKSNNPVIKHHHPQYTPLHMLPNAVIKQSQVAAMAKEIQRNRNFFAGPEVDNSLPETRR